MQPQQQTPPTQNPQPAGPTPTQVDAQQTNAKPNSTQNALRISEIRDGIVIMKDGSYRAVVMAQSINFDLMSPQEREGVEQSYQGFLNALYFPIQIMMRSQRVDLRIYMEKLNKIREQHTNTLLSLLMEDYLNYIEYLSQSANIMEKQFFVVVPFEPVTVKNAAKKVGLFTSLFNNKPEHIVIGEQEFNNAKTELKTRVQSVLEAMNQMNVQAIPLNTRELIELYYDVYNPDTATTQPMIDPTELDGRIVTKGDGPNPRSEDQ